MDIFAFVLYKYKICQRTQCIYSLQLAAAPLGKLAKRAKAAHNGCIRELWAG
jgi:hypothetical protein